MSTFGDDDTELVGDNDGFLTEGESDGDDDGDDESIRIPIQRSSGRGNNEDAPVANAGAIPLFADADKRGTNTAQYLKITKTAGEGRGYKGQLPLSSNEETIFQAHGDGTYTVELMNHKHRVLRSKENIQISLGAGGGASRLPGNTSPDNDPVHKHLAYTLQKQNENHQKELERQERASGEVTKQVIANAQSHAAIVTATTEAAANRERDFMKGMIEQQQGFFGNMILMMQNSFNQTMALLTTGHTMTMEQLRATNEREAQQNNPMLMLSLFKEGISLGKDMDGDNEPEYMKALGMGVKGLTELKDLALMHRNPGTPPAKALVTPAPGTPSVVKPKAAPNPTPGPKKTPILSKDEIVETVRLKNALRKRGIDLEEMLKQASEHYDKASDDEIFNQTSEESNDSDESEEPEEEVKETPNDSNPTPESNVES